MALLSIVLTAFTDMLGPIERNWRIRNPIGFIRKDWLDTYLLTPWIAGLAALTVLCGISLFVRFRRARAQEREQIKWLFYAGGLFVAIYVPALYWTDFSSVFQFWEILFVLGILAIPTAIAFAIPR